MVQEMQIDYTPPKSKSPVSFFSIDDILRNKGEVEDDVFESEDTCSNSACSTDSSNINPKSLSCSSDDMTRKDDKEILPSYTTIIAQAILSSQEKKLPLGAVYEYIAQHFPGILKKGQGWRNCVRHNLSLSECFIKAGKARNGRGNYWGIHPRYIKNFSNGDYRKRPSAVRPRHRVYRNQYQNAYIRYSISQQQYSTNNTSNTVRKSNFSIDSILSTNNKISKPKNYPLSSPPPPPTSQMRYPPTLYPHIPKSMVDIRKLDYIKPLAYHPKAVCTCRSCVY